MQKGSTPIKVNVDNFISIETANQFARYLQLAGGQMNTWYHFRRPVDITQQPTIRMNQDTLYSGALVDISQKATLAMPHTGGRYQSVMVINAEGYINRVYDQPGTYPLTIQEFETPFVLLGARTILSTTALQDIKKANALQDGLAIVAQSFTIRFGGDPSLPNMLPIMDDWNYMVRYYGPQKSVLNGSFRFPKLKEKA